MRIKKFTGATLREATEQMKAELGPEAIVLNSRKIARGGALSFLGKEMFEVVAATDEAGSGTGSTYARRTPPEVFSQGPSRDGPSLRADNPAVHLSNIARQFQGSSQQLPEASGAVRRPGPAPEFLELRSEMEEVKGAMRDIAEHLKYSRMPALPEHLRRAYSHLIEQDVQEKVAADLVQSVYGRLNHEEMADRNRIRTYLLEAMALLFPVGRESKGRRRKSRVVTLVGPTGVGKTTTIAKLAAIHKLVDHLDVALISADTYRIGAIEQLRTFAAIADIPMEVVYRSSEMGTALRKFRSKDVILVDTVGRSQRSKDEIRELARFVAAADPDEIHLVLSAATSAKTALDTIQQFKVVRPNRLLFSKLDEAATLGTLLTVAQGQPMPISYLTTGQTVPDDIRIAEPSQLASMIYAGEVAHA